MSGEMLDLVRVGSWAGIVLLVCALVAAALSETDRTSDDFNPVIANFYARVRGWWVMLVLMGGAYLIAPGAMVFVTAIVSLGALREFLTLTTRSAADHKAFVASFFVVLPIQYITIWQDWYGFYSVFIPVYAFLLLPMLSVLQGRVDRFLDRVAQTQWALMIAVFCVSHVAAVLYLDIPGFEGGNLLLLMFLVLVVQGADLLQHLWSTCFGKHPIAENISRSRTWEGFYGGLLSAGVLGACLSWLTPYGVLPAALMGIAIAGVGGMGRMVMTAIKLDRGVRDWGHMNDGQGGFLDRLDSVIFAAPIFFHLTRFFWT